MSTESEIIPDIIRGIRECSLTDHLPAGDNVQPSVRSHHTPPFRKLVLREPLGKVLYKDETVIRQIYDTVTAVARDDKKHDLYEQLTSLEWKSRDGTNFDYLVLLLSSTVYAEGSVSDLVFKIKKERTSRIYTPIVYPAMPIRLRGVIWDKGDVFKRRIRLRDDKSSIRIIMDKEHTLHQDLSFLKERVLFILGIIHNIETGTVKAGAVLL